MRSVLILVPCLALLPGVHGQNLLPSIGLDVLPGDAELVCPIPDQVGGIANAGYHVGDTAADFRLYDLEGNAFHLGSVLASGKPVLMVAGSWTCPVYRDRIGHINQMKALYGDLLEVVIVYTVEAHPIIDISPYFGAVNPGATNLAAGITFQQPTTYGERKAMVEVMMDSMNVTPPVYIDGPCNAWWEYYGPAPNNAYVIGTDGIIAVKHGWYDKYPDDMECDIREFLELPDECDAGEYPGAFVIQWVSNDTVYGPSGTTLTGTLEIHNSTADPVQVQVIRMQNDEPPGWSGSLCLDVCYTPEVDDALIVLDGGATQLFHYYFYTGPEAAVGHIRIGFRNVFDNTNQFSRHLWGISEGTVGIGSVREDHGYALFPNPTNGPLWIRSDRTVQAIRILDLLGREVMIARGSNDLDLSALQAGEYLVRVMIDGSWSSGASRLVLR